MRKRQGNNPTRRLIAINLATPQLIAEILAQANYLASGHHKRFPANYQLKITNPRPTKSLCDEQRVIRLEEVTDLMLAGIKAGMFSQPNSDKMPKFIWSVSAQGEVFEAKTHPNTPWQYHGYPINNEPSFCKYILSEWKRRHV